MCSGAVQLAQKTVRGPDEIQLRRANDARGLPRRLRGSSPIIARLVVYGRCNGEDADHRKQDYQMIKDYFRHAGYGEV